MSWTKPHSEFYRAHQQLESALKGGDTLSHSATDDSNSKGLVQQNIELRQKLEEQHSSYKRKLTAYQDGQQRQAQLVQKLQAKVLQYKKKCGELEEQVRSLATETDRSRRSLRDSQDGLRTRLESTETKLRMVETDHSMDLETTLIKLEEEQQRSASLAHVNTMLREQLDQATAANQSLTSDIHKLTQDWQRAREELECKEAEWREEEQSFNEYFSAEHSRLLSLWRAVVSFRRQFSEMKVSCERDMSHMRGDVTRSSRSMHSACLNLSANLRNTDTQSQVSLDQERSERMNIEAQLRDHARNTIDLQARCDAQSAEMTTRINELTILNENLKVQIQEKDKTVATFQRTVAALETRMGDSPRSYHDQTDGDEDAAARMEREEIDAMHEALRRIAREVITDADRSVEDDMGDPELSTSVLRASSPLRTPSRGRRSASSSPVRHRSPGRSLSPHRAGSPSRAPSFADSTYAAVQAALNKRQLQVTELRAKLTANKEQGMSQKRSLDDLQNTYRQLEHQLLSVKEERDNASRSHQDAEKAQERLRGNLDLAGTERNQLERARQSLNEQVEGMSLDVQRLQAANAELQRQRDLLEDQKEDVNKDKERQMKENERCRRAVDQSDGKASKLKEELVNTKEHLNRACLDREVLEQEKLEINEALSRAELCKAELELEINKTKADEASLRDALLKMQSLNEGLGQDKIELNKIILQMEADKGELVGMRQAVEQEKSGLKDELLRVEQEKMDLDNEKTGISHSLSLTEQSREHLEGEIRLLNREKAELTEQLGIVTRQKNALAEELIGSRKEIERQSDTIVRVAKKEKSTDCDSR